MEEKPVSTEEEITASPMEQPPVEPLTPSFWEKLKANKFKILGGVLGIIVIVGGIFGAYRLGQRQVQSTPTPSPTVVVTSTPDPTADWKTYTNTKYGYSIKYPEELESKEVDPSTVLGPTGVTTHNFIVWGPTQRPQTEFYDGLSVTLGLVTNPEELSLRDFADQVSQPTVGERESFEEIQVGDLRGFRAVGVGLGRFTHIFLPYKTADKVVKFTAIWGGEKEEEYRETFNLILSTFRFLEPSTVSPSPTPVAQNYPRPSNWEAVTIPSMKISLCLPPKWVVGTDHYSDDYREIFFERDPNYRPRATSISKIPYSGGSRREEYINSKVQYEYEPEKLKEETTVKEIIINGRSVLDIAIPSFPEELVFAMDDFLYSVDVDYKNLVNDSPSAFRKDIYIIVGCIKPI